MRKFLILCLTLFLLGGCSAKESEDISSLAPTVTVEPPPTQNVEEDTAERDYGGLIPETLAIKDQIKEKYLFYPTDIVINLDSKNIYNGDTLEHDYFGDMKFRVQVANPPYSANWSADMHFMEDERFNEYGKLAPKSKADFAFVQHMVYHMDEDGRAVVLLPHGVLFRGAAEEVIRKHLIQKLNVLDAVIGLPANLFFGTGIPVCVLVLKRERNGNSDNILFIDASNDFEAGKNQNILRECDIDKIVETYEHRVDVDKYAHVATMQEIEENGFNLNIPRYVDTFEPEEEIDLNAVAAEIRNIQAEIKGIDAQLKPFFDELGLDFPFDVEGK